MQKENTLTVGQWCGQWFTANRHKWNGNTEGGYRPMKEGVKHRKCFTPSFIVILFSAPHSGWPNAGAAAFLLLCEGNLGT